MTATSFKTTPVRIIYFSNTTSTICRTIPKREWRIATIRILAFTFIIARCLCCCCLCRWNSYLCNSSWWLTATSFKTTPVRIIYFSITTSTIYRTIPKREWRIATIRILAFTFIIARCLCCCCLCRKNCCCRRWCNGYWSISCCICYWSLCTTFEATPIRIIHSRISTSPGWRTVPERKRWITTIWIGTFIILKLFKYYLIERINLCTHLYTFRHKTLI